MQFHKLHSESLYIHILFMQILEKYVKEIIYENLFLQFSYYSFLNYEGLTAKTDLDP